MAARDLWQRQVPKDYQCVRWSLCPYQQELADWTEHLVAGRKLGLVLSGKTSLGKTSAMAIIAAVLSVAGEPFTWWYCPDLHDFLRDPDNRVRSLATRWLLWDDAGLGHGREHTISRLVTLFEERRGFPTIVTTNMSVGQWQDRDGFDKIRSRLLPNLMDWIEDGGE